MDFWVIIQAFIVGMVEGFTEFLPISSTGHQVIAVKLLGFDEGQSMTFNIIIQLGAICALIWEFKSQILKIVTGLCKDFQSRRIALNVIVAVLPVIFLGLLLADVIHDYFFNSVIVAAIAWITGGIIIIWVEHHSDFIKNRSLDKLSWKNSLQIGLIQCLALIPGVSRSGATIVGGLFLGLSRKSATQFSFYLAIPTMFGAAFYSGYRHYNSFQLNDIYIFISGFLSSYIFARISIKFLLKFISMNDYRVFGWYRIVLGILMLIWETL